MPFNPFSALTSKIFAGTAAVLLIVLGVMLLLHKHDLATADKLRTALAQTNAKLAVSNASIASLQTVIAQRNAEIEQRAKDYAAAKQRADSESAKLAGKARDTDARIARLGDMAKAKGDCPVKPEIAKLARGL